MRRRTFGLLIGTAAILVLALDTVRSQPPAGHAPEDLWSFEAGG
jgi:hypothetical protein